MKTHELHSLNVQELQVKLDGLKREYEQYLDAVVSGKEKNYSRIRQVRRSIARVKTLLQSRI